MQIRFYHFLNKKIGVRFFIVTLLLVAGVSILSSFSYSSNSEEEDSYFANTIPNPTETKSTSLGGDPPIANPDTINVLQGTSGTGNVLDNDIEPDGETIVINTTPTGSPSNGTVTINPDGTYTYVPFPFFVGTDQFSYEICDGSISEQVTSSFSADDVPVVITEFAGGFSVTSTINVPSGGSIMDVNIPNLFIEHSYVYDLTVTLTSPSGTSATLVDKLWCAGQDIDLGFDDESPSGYGDIPCSPDDGDTYQPTGNLSVFDNENSTGDWVLTITDDSQWDGGALENWELEITTLGAGSNTNCAEATVTILVFSSSTEICSNEIDDDGDGLVDVFDPDCPCDDGNFFGLCDTECEYIPPGEPNFDIALEWTSEDSVNTFTPVVGANLDGDPSSVEIVAFKGGWDSYTDDALFVIDGSNGQTKYTFESKPLHVFAKGISLADADRDGNGEIYFMIGNSDPDDYRKIACYEYNPAATNLGGTGTGNFELKWVSGQRVTCGLAYPLNTVTDRFAVNLADFNSDGFPEVYVGNEIYNALTGARIASGGANNIGNSIYNFYLHEHFHANPVAIDAIPTNDCTDCKGLELVAGNQVYSVDLATGTMTVERELASSPGYQDGQVSVADYDLDGDVDGIITTTDSLGSYLYVWDLQTETLMASHTVTDIPIDQIWYRSVSNATVADFDGDNKPEIGVCGNFVFQVVEDYQTDISNTGGVAWSLVTTDRSGMTGATAFDFNADGLTEVVYRDEDDLRIISGSSGINLSTFPCGSRTGVEYPIVLDVDDDNETELICTCGSTGNYDRNGFVQAFRSDQYPWVPTRNVWNQYAYFITNVNDNLYVPPLQQPHHLVGNPPLGTTGRMNSFLKQVGPYDNEGNPSFPAANIQTNVLDGGADNCVNQDSIDVTVRFYNFGDLAFPAGIPFAVYEGNPEIDGTLVGTYIIPTAIIPNDSLDVTITIALSALNLPSNLFVIGNDDGSLPLPLSLANDFPATSIGECDFENNMDSIPITDCETQAPTLVGVPANITVGCDEVPDPPNVTASDNCTTDLSVDYSFTQTTGTCSYTITRTWTAEDDCGNEVTDSQIIIVEDNSAPTLSGIPSDMTVDCNDMVPDWPNVTALDDCSGVLAITTDSTVTSGDCPFTITRTWTVTDNCNNSFSQSQNISVLDTIFPVFVGIPPNITVECTELPDPADVTVSDNCDNDIELTYEDVYLPNGNYADSSVVTIPASGNSWNIDITSFSDLSASDFLTFALSFESNKGKGRAEFFLINPSGQGIFLVGEHCTTGDCASSGNATKIWSPTFYRCDTGFPQWNNEDNIPPAPGDFIPHGGTPIDPIPGVTEYVDCFEDFTGPMNGQWKLYARKNQTANGLLKFQSFNFGFGDHSCLEEGVILRKWTATDDCGNTTNASQTIYLEDTTPPVIDVPADVTVECDNIPSLPTLTADDCIDNVSVVFIDEVTSSGCPYTVTRRWMAEDICGNIDTVTHVITVIDTHVPDIEPAPDNITISCTDDIPDPVDLTATDNCTEDIEVDYSEDISTDCPITITRTWTATDECDNDTTVTQIITIIDEDAPIFSNVPSDLTVECNSIPDTANVIANDNCDDNFSLIFMEEKTDGICSYTITRKWVAEDVCGNKDSVIQVITVEDTEEPVFDGVPENVTVNCDAIPAVATVTVTDNCTTNLPIDFKENRTYGCPYTITRTWSVEDSCGTETIATQIITVQDNVAPTLIGVPSDVTVDCENIPDTAIVTASDNCYLNLEVSFSETQSGSCPNTITRTWSVTDSCNNVITDEQVITVLDTVAPIFTTFPNDITLNCGDALPDFLNPTATDNCSNFTVEFSGDDEVAGSCEGSYVVQHIYHVEDDCGNGTEQILTITYIDTIAPTITIAAQNMNVDCDADIQVELDAWLANQGGASASDVCSEVTWSYDPNPPLLNDGCGNSGSVTVTFTATDDCGNSDTTSATFTVLPDTAAPTLSGTPSDVTVACDAVPDTATVTAIDNCTSNVNVVFSEAKTEGACSYTITRKWVATDECNNADSVIQVITVEDTEGPVFSGVPSDVTVNCDAIPDTANVTVTDNCTSNLTIDFSETRTYGCPYYIARVWRVTDSCGTETVASQLITVQDNIAPTLIGVPSDVTVDCENIPDTAIVTVNDTCYPDLEVTFSETLGTGCPYTITRTWSATDSCNNVVTDEQIITVVDTVGPTFTSFPTDITIDCGEGIPNYTFPTVVDNCTGATVELQDSLEVAGTCEGSYVMQYIFVGTDLCGNETEEILEVTYIDTIAPTITIAAQNMNVDCDADIQAELDAWLVNQGGASASDICSEVTWSYDPNPPLLSNGCGNSGSVTVTFTATDDCGNSDTTSATFTVLPDTAAPTLSGTPSDVTVACDAVPDTATVTAIDNCTSNVNVVFSEAKTEGACSYTITRKWVATDECNNADSVIQVITVEDTEGPVFSGVPSDVTVNCDAIPDTANVTVTDNCTSNLTIDFSETRTYGCPYYIARVWRVTDSCGTETVANQLITVQDNIAPTLVGVPSDVTVDCENIPDTAIVTVNDTCYPDLEVIFSETVGTGCPYTITRTWSATDSCNNVVTDEQIITVVDTVGPTFTSFPTDITIDCGEGIPSYTFPTVVDNCTGATVELQDSLEVAGTCEGSYVMQYIFVGTDLCGNETEEILEVTYIDTIAPTITIAAQNMNVDCDADIQAELDTWLANQGGASASDVCSEVTWSYLPNPPLLSDSCGNSGSVTIMFTASDDCGNSDTTSATFTVLEDTTAPELLGGPIDVTVACDAIPDTAIVTAIDNCTSDVTITFSETETTGTCSYTITRKWVATDECNNADSVIQVITIEDTEGPVFSGIPSDVTVNCDVIPDTAIVLATDNCTSNLMIEFSEVRSTGCPYTITRKWKTEDECGFVDSVVQIILVEDNDFPTLVGVPDDITVNCDNIPVADIVTANDDCVGNLMVDFNEVRTYGCPYTITRTWIAKDSCNNQVIETQVITVEDNTLPSLVGVPDDITVNCEAIPDTAIVTSNDNCFTGLEVTFSETKSSGCPYTITRTWTVVDSCNNEFTDSQVITVNDNSLPTLIGVPDDVTVNCNVIPEPAEVTVLDNCWDELLPVLVSVTSSGCPYTITRTWTATDSCGNSSSSTQVITVEDEDGPVLETPPADITINCNTPIPDAVELAATDNCSDEEIEDVDFSEETTGECPYVITRSWTAYDECDNETTVTQTITIIDTVPPTLSNLPVDITLDCGAIPDTQQVVASDICDSELNIVFEEIYSDSTCDNTFKITRSWTVSDNCGNIATHTQNIQIQDTIPPTFSGVPSDVMLPCDSIPENLTPIATDNCGEVQVEYTEVEVEGDCIDLRLLTRTWTATDACGNQTVAIQNIVFNNCASEATVEISPANVVCEGMEVTFTAILTDGYDTPNYQWQYSNDGVTWSDISGANSITYTLTVMPSDSGFYQVIIANDPADLDNPMCSIISNTQPLSVIPQTVTIETIDLEICAGDSITVGNSIYFETGNFIDTLDASSGCDSAIVNLNLTVFEVYEINIDSTICDGESVLIGNSTYNQDGIFINNLNTIEGCDSIVILNLTVNPSPEVELNETLCEGQTIIIGVNTYAESGVYIDTLQTIEGCDSIVTLNLTINEIQVVDLIEDICPGESYTVGTSIYSQSGIYQDTMIALNGCDSIVNLDLTVRDTFSIDLIEFICDGEEIVVGDSTYTASGNYWNVLETIHGCDSIVTLDLTVYPNYLENIEASICLGDIYEVGDSVYTMSGIYTTTLESSLGCDSVIVLDLTVRDTFLVSLTEEICLGDIYEVGDSVYTMSGIYTTTLESSLGCDSVIVLDLTVRDTFLVSLTEEICLGDIYEVGDSVYTMSGIYTTTLESSLGCDSVVVLDLTVHDTFLVSLTEEICLGDIYEVGDSVYTMSGIYTTTLESSLGCDSVIVLDLTVHDTFLVSLTEEICLGDIYEVGDSVYTMSGIYTTTLESSLGCDSVIVLDLTVHDTFLVSLTEEICLGDIYEVGDSVYTMSGIYTTTLESSLGCDSVIVLDLTVHDTFLVSLTEEICLGDIYEVGDSIYTMSGIYTTTLESSLGCDSVIVLDLTVHDTFLVSLTEEICLGDIYEVGDSIYTMSGIYTTTLESSLGCDSVIVLDLTVHDTFLVSLTEEICLGDIYEVGDSVYTMSGIYTTTLESSLGCDSVIVLDLTVHDTFLVSLTEEICLGDIYEVGDSIYTMSGIYTTTLESSLGCDSVIVLDLTVHDTFLVSLTEEICLGDIYEVGDSIYTMSGIYTTTLESSLGCDSVIVLDLTVHDTFLVSLTEEICLGDIYEVGDSVYAMSGIYTTTLESSLGCDSVVVLDLTVHDTFLVSLTEEICLGDTYEVGDSVYTMSGIYTTILESSLGCDSVITLELNVIQIDTVNLNEFICLGQAFEVGDSIYSETGIYTTILTSSANCDSVIILDLVVDDILEINLVETICSGDSIVIGSSVYFESGSYSDTMQTTSGCDSLIVLNLTVNDTFLVTLTEEICNGYIYEVGDSIYNTSGIYTTNLLSEGGCDSVVILHLTVYDTFTTLLEVNICEGDSILINGNYQTSNGQYQNTLSSINGCDSIVITELTVLPTSATEVQMGICLGDSILLGGVYQTMTGIYQDTLLNANGCDSIVTTILTVEDGFVLNIEESICLGDSILIGGTYESISGVYTDSLMAQSGCDSIVTTILTVEDGFVLNIEESICLGDSIQIGGTYESTSGVYTDSLMAQSGCDSIIVTTLTVNSEYETPLTATICQGDSIMLGGVYQTTTGVYQDSLLTETGCDSIITTSLTVLAGFEYTITAEICIGDSILIDGTYESTSGVYTDSLTAENGCDSIVITELTVLPISATELQMGICVGDSILLGGVYQTMTGTYQDTLLNANGCDSIVTTILTVEDGFVLNIEESICLGDSILIGGMYESTSGVYTDSLTAQSGCDSIIVTTLTVNSEYETPLTATICQGDSIMLGGVYQTMTGVYQDSLLTETGCDSIITTNLTVLTGFEFTITAEICIGDSILIGGTYESTSGIYRDSLIAENGCDSIVITELTVLPISATELQMGICVGDSILLGGVYQTMTGTYQDTLLNANGCDSIVTTILTVEDGFVLNIEESICLGDSILIGGMYESTSGVYTDSLTAQSGCDSIIVTTLTVNSEYETPLTATICQGDSIMLGGVYQTMTGVYQDSLLTETGCDSIITTNLTVLTGFEFTITAEICIGDSILIGGTYESTSGIYRDSLIAGNGCDSIVITELTVLPISATELQMGICVGDSILLGGVYQTMTGTYQDTLLNANGCDSIVTTILTVEDGFVLNIEESICLGDSILIGGMYESTSGVYTDSLTAQSGCDSIIVTTLTVNSEYETPLTATICQGDSIMLGGVYQTMTGVYQDSLLTETGCDSIITTNLTVLTGFEFTITAEICIGDSILIGGTYESTSGIYRDSLIAENGCDSIVITELTVLPISATELQMGICVGDSILLGGVYQTMTGTYQDTLLNANGCDSIVTTILTVEDGFVLNIEESICLGDSILIGGMYESTSGVYTDSLTAQSGCDSIIVTTLTVNSEYETPLTATICQGDSIMLGGVYQTMTGVYQDSLLTETGCDSIITTNLTVLTGFEFTITAEICIGDSILIGGTYESTSGIYRDSLIAGNGCDSIVITELTVLPISATELQMGICVGDSILLGGVYQTMTGTYQDTLLNANGCDSIVTTILTVEDGFVLNIEESICLGDSILIGGMYESTSGVYTDSLTAQSGCDSIIVTTLTVNSEYETPLTATICQGDSIMLGGVYQTMTGVYQDSLLTETGCDSIITTNLTVLTGFEFTITAEICIGDSILIGGTYESTSGIYRDSLIAENGCDSIVITELTVLPISATELQMGICVGDSILLGGVYQTMTGTYQDTLLNANGCDSIVTTILTVEDGFVLNIEESICLGDSILIGGMYESTSGVYTDSLTAQSGCDSIIVTTLTVNSEYETPLTATICQGDSIMLGGVYQTMTGVYQDSLLTETGCDSIITTTLTVYPNEVTNEFVTICSNEEHFVGGSNQNTSGIYQDTLQTINGCDSIIITELTVLPSYETPLAVSICEGEEYLAGGILQSTNGVYQDTLTALNGCDSVVITTLSILDVFIVNVDTAVCEGESVLLAGIEQTESGVFTDTLSSIGGCDSIIITNLVVNDIYNISNTVNICEGDSILLGGSYQMTAGLYYDTLTTIHNCDSIITTDLNVLPSHEISLEISICEGDKYFAGGANQSISGTYVDTLTNSFGCDSVVITTLDVKPISITNLVEEVCQGDSYFFAGVEWYSGGNYVDTLVAANGCDSIINLDLTILPQSQSALSEVICEGSNYTLGTETYNETGTYTQVFEAANGCDSTVTLVLVVTPEIVMNPAVTVCEEEGYELNGEVLTTSGVYTDTLTAATGCDSIINLNLNILPTEEYVFNVAICEGESYTVGAEEYSTAGVYTDTLTSFAGCDSIVTLNLSVEINYQLPISAIICSNDHFQVGDVFYTESGMYIDTLASVTGCDSIIMLNLNVIESSSTLIDTAICAGEVLQMGNNVYSSPGVFTETYQNVNGCDSTVTLALAISNVQPTVIYQDICQGDSILLEGAYQTSGGVFTNMYLSASGCDSAVFTYLTVVDEITSLVQEVICEGDSIFLAGNFRYEPGEFTDVFTSANTGCDSIVTIELLVEPATEIYVEGLDLCLGEEGQLFVEGATEVSWSPTVGLSCDDCPNPIVSPTSTTSYKVSTQSCLGTTVETSVTVYVNTPPELFVSDDVTILKGGSIKLIASTDDFTDIVTWTLENNEVLCENCRELDVSPEETTTYYVTTIDDNGCEAVEEVVVKVNDGCQSAKLDIPNMFSPNGDGFNDLFEIRHEGFSEIKTLKIYNRWGELVFETNDVDLYWDGTFRGKSLNPGVYVYYLEAICLSEEASIYTGNVTILK